MHDEKEHREGANAGAPTDGRSPATVKADLHCHSSASARASLDVQRALALPECATSPSEVYALAKRRGMDFVTITDHDTIDGVLEIAGDPDVFISEELTASFRDEPQAVHVLCYGITPDDHEWLQAHRTDVVGCADYLHAGEIACALAHPFFNVAAPLTPSHRRLLAELFPVWETRNGTRPRELNAPAAIYIETHGGIAVGGSDDHAGTDIGRTFSEAPMAASPADFLAHIRTGRVWPCGDEGSAAKWAHSALVLAARTVGADLSAAAVTGALEPATILRVAERIINRSVSGQEEIGGLGPQDARRLLAAWLEQTELNLGLDALLACFQADDFSHASLELRVRRIHERKLARAVTKLTADGAAGNFFGAIAPLVAACLPAVPYVPAQALRAHEHAKLTGREGDVMRVAVIADGLSHVHGVATTLSQLRERGVPGYAIDVIGTDANVDRRLPAVTDVELPYYPGLTLGVPSLFAVADALTERRYDLVHVCAPGPAGIAAALIARVMGLPLIGSYHTELQAYVRSRTGEARLEALMAALLSGLYRSCAVVLSPSDAADRSLAALGVPSKSIRRWQRGVDSARFHPSRRREDLWPGRFNVLYVGRLSQEKGVDLLAEAFLTARDRDRRLHLVLAGRGPEEELLRKRLGGAATFLGWLEGEELATAYASADLFLFASTTDTFGQVILEAQASGLPVLAVNAGGPAELIEDGRSGCLVAPNAEALAGALRGVARRQTVRRRLSNGGLLAVRERTWEHSLAQLAKGYAEARGQVGTTAPFSAPLPQAA